MTIRSGEDSPDSDVEEVATESTMVEASQSNFVASVSPKMVQWNLDCGRTLAGESTEELLAPVVADDVDVPPIEQADEIIERMAKTARGKRAHG